MSRESVCIVLLAIAAASIGPARGNAGAAASSSITGVVRFKGKAPPPISTDRSSESSCSQKATYLPARVTAGLLAEVHVRVKSGTAGSHKLPRLESVTVKQEDCTYLPRVAGIMKGQILAIENKDGVLHNVHARLDGETWFNRSQPRGVPALQQKDYGDAGQVLELGCDVHPWMKAYIPVTDHPFFTVTGETGAFALRNLVPGKTFTVEAWHPTLGLKTRQAKSGDRVEFTFP